MKKTLHKNEDFFCNWSPNMAYILGFIMADGCIMHKDYTKSAYGYTLMIDILHKDIEVLDFIKAQIEFEGEIRNYTRIRKNGKASNFSVVSINSKKIVDSLMSLGVIPRKTGFESIPKDIPKDLVRDFIRGYFDGDGCIMYKKYKYSNGNYYDWWSLDISCLNDSFLLDIAKIMQEYIGVNIENKVKFETRCNRLRFRKKEDICKIIKWLYYDKDIFSLSRKRELANNILGDYYA